MSTLLGRAQKQAQKLPMGEVYVYCTNVKWVISRTKPPFNRQFIRVLGNGYCEMHEHNSETDTWKVTPLETLKIA